jgi:tetratricopeptide (TPR) repeat protein
VLYYKEQLDEAEQLDRRALSIREKAHGSEHIDTLNSLNNLARTLLKKDDYEAAEKLFIRLLADCKEVLGLHHEKTMDVMLRLDILERWKGGFRIVYNSQTPERW